MTISDIYKQYQIPYHLQEHMLRVAAISSYVGSYWTSDLKIDLHMTITAGLIHDLGNLVKFDFDVMPEIFDEDIDIYKSLQQQRHKKYGHDCLQATIAIMKELSLSPQYHSMILDIDSKSSIENSLFHYSDRRVGPYGVITLDERIYNLRERYRHRGRLNEGSRQQNLAIWKGEEDNIFRHCSISPHDIKDTTISPLLDSLKTWVI